MANVSQWDRGQMLIIGGVLLATTLVILVLLLNSAIYVENFSSRGADSEVDRTVNIQQEIQAEYEAIVSNSESDEEIADWAELNETITDQFSLLVDHHHQRALERGAFLDIGMTLERGLLLDGYQTELDEPVILAEGITGSHSLELIINLTTLEKSTPWNESLKFSAGEWEMFINRTSDEGVQLIGADGETLVSDGNAPEETRIDILGGALNDESGEFDWSSSGTPPTEDGTFELTMDPQNEAAPNIEVSLVANGSTVDSDLDTASPIVDRASLEMQYRSGDLELSMNSSITRWADR